ncbi:MAG: tripartite tricarboxylate transporter TctB family protein [Gemmatimonadota bacterium]
MRNPLVALPKDYLGGALMVLLGVGAMVEGARYSIGSLNRMGPGFFPVALGALLTLIGIAIGMAAWLERAPAAAADREPLPPEWRGWACIVGSVIAFIVLGHYAGLVPATAAIVFISALGDRENTVRSALLLTALMLAICIVVFWWALQMTFPLFHWG